MEPNRARNQAKILVERPGVRFERLTSNRARLTVDGYIFDIGVEKWGYIEGSCWLQIKKGATADTNAMGVSND